MWWSWLWHHADVQPSKHSNINQTTRTWINIYWHVHVHPCQGGQDLGDTMLKGGFHNGPQWGWNDGYALSLEVNATGLRPLQVHAVASFAICEHWVGTSPWPGPGQHAPGPPTMAHLSLRGKVGEVNLAHVQHRRRVHLHITQFNLYL